MFSIMSAFLTQVEGGDTNLIKLHRFMEAFKDLFIVKKLTKYQSETLKKLGQKLIENLKGKHIDWETEGNQENLCVVTSQPSRCSIS
jgi:hypothetical protein